ncbi:alpha/beta hydrolase [Agromyces sp. SYSU T00266]|uniref:alpha/beta hydrolase n=1 Tax=Agromyces zhanjiangensis TaxID=3158562 RepID=UPI003395D276
MVDVESMPAARDDVRTLTFEPPAARADPRTETLTPESQAALRQFSEDRLIGYGVDRSDAIELTARVLAGEGWLDAATRLAERCLANLDAAAEAGTQTRITALRRASALLRMSQVMMLEDGPARTAIYARAGDLYLRAAEIACDRIRVTLDTPEGAVVGWQVPATGPRVGAAIVIGGVEGYAMDFDCIGDALAARGIETLLLDGPGQGESRFTHGVYLTPTWRDAYTAALDHLATSVPGLPIGVVGNSMGGSFAMAVANEDPRVRACVDNGGIPAPWMVPPSIGTFFTKMAAFCDVDDPDQATAVWSTVTPLAPGGNADYDLLVIQGGADPMVSSEMAQAVFAHAPAKSKQMVLFSDGIHCIYNHRTDRDDLIADWVHARLAADSHSDFDSDSE